MEFRDGDFSLDESSSMFECCGEEHGNGRVKEGNASANFAGEGVKVRGESTAFPSGMRTVFAGAEAWDRVA